MRRKSLRIQITAAVGIIVTLACLALTANSIYSANNYYAGYLEDQSSSEAMVPPPGTYDPYFMQHVSLQFTKRGFSPLGEQFTPAGSFSR